MRYFLDCEFLDDGKTIDLISIGIVANDGREYYAQSSEFDPARADEWIKENVLKHLDPSPLAWKTREQIAREVAEFCSPEQYEQPDFYGWYAAYDWVALCQLYGRMLDIPKGWPWYVRDLQAIIDGYKPDIPELPKQTGAQHNALDDARHIRTVMEYVLAIPYNTKDAKLRSRILRDVFGDDWL